MKKVVIRLLAAGLAFSFAVVLTVTYCYVTKEKKLWNTLTTNPSKLLPISCQRLLFAHPLTFDLTMAGCGLAGFTDVFQTSDNETVSHSSHRMESSTIAKQKLQEHIINLDRVLDRQTLVNPRNSQPQFRITGVSKENGKEKISIITVEDANIRIITAPTLWHAQEFEFYLKSSY